jgi:hypothetical protein
VPLVAFDRAQLYPWLKCAVRDPHPLIKNLRIASAIGSSVRQGIDLLLDHHHFFSDT